MRIRKAIFPVAGMGTRFLPATKALPKEMLPVIDKPLIQYAVEEALASGIEQIIFVTGRGKSAIEDHFDYSFELNTMLQERGKTDILAEINSSVLTPGRIAYVRQQEPLGLGHAVWCARHLIGDEPFAVILADDLIQSKTPCLKQMIESYKSQNLTGSMIAAMEIDGDAISSYGVFDVSRDTPDCLFARGLVEKPHPSKAPSRYAAIGRYILSPQVLKRLESLEKGAGGEIQLTDAIAKSIQGDDLCGFKFEGTRFDCGSKEGFLRATLSYALSREDLKSTALDIINHYSTNQLKMKA